MPKQTDQLTHLNEAGEAHIVDVSDKPVTSRVATAESRLRMQPATLAAILAGEIPKGDVLAVARVAGIQAAKKCPDLIPLCHPLALSSVEIDIAQDPDLPGLIVRATCKVTGQTGVEMEALTAATVASLTLYDMCKAIDRGMTIEHVGLLTKSGGSSGAWRRDDHH